jgi:DNA (cytosine-5)-methyltransferase 1
MTEFRVLEICAGAGGQALGLEEAGFDHAAAVEIDPTACETLRVNRPAWNVVQADVRKFDATEFVGVDLVAGGVPCPPFSVAGKQLGSDDERDLFPTALKLVEVTQPRAVLLENVPGLATQKFTDYRCWVREELDRLGYRTFWKVLHAQDYSVPQLRPRFVLVALRSEEAEYFAWPAPRQRSPSVGETLRDLMGSLGWPGADSWADRATGIAPTIVGGSKLHGGPDLGPTRAKKAWEQFGVNGMGIADEPPGASFDADGHPKLTVRMCARIQGFPDSWAISGRKTAAYRQVGNAFPPPVARAVGEAIRSALLFQQPTREEYALSLVATA